MSDILRKKILASAGITWFIYLILHMLANLQFFSGAESFNSFYNWFNGSPVLFLVVNVILLVGIVAHVVIAVMRQLQNNEKRKQDYQVPYPKGVPRLIAWSGAAILLSFIIFHVFHVLILNDADYAFITNAFQSPIILAIYALGIFALTAHLHHALGNVLQTMGVTEKQNHMWVGLILLILIGGFVSVPISIIFS